MHSNNKYSYTGCLKKFGEDQKLSIDAQNVTFWTKNTFFVAHIVFINFLWHPVHTLIILRWMWKQNKWIISGVARTNQIDRHRQWKQTYPSSKCTCGQWWWDWTDAIPRILNKTKDGEIGQVSYWGYQRRRVPDFLEKSANF